MNKYEKLESLFEEIIPLLADIFSDAEMSEVCEFLEAGEYWFANDTIVAIFVEEKKCATPKIISLVHDLAVEMKLDPEIYTSRLRVE